jgi:hypothetical protein
MTSTPPTSEELEWLRKKREECDKKKGEVLTKGIFDVNPVQWGKTFDQVMEVNDIAKRLAKTLDESGCWEEAKKAIEAAITLRYGTGGVGKNTLAVFLVIMDYHRHKI